jgi:hypothetical protein
MAGPLTALVPRPLRPVLGTLVALALAAGLAVLTRPLQPEGPRDAWEDPDVDGPDARESSAPTRTEAPSPAATKAASPSRADASTPRGLPAARPHALAPTPSPTGPSPREAPEPAAPGPDVMVDAGPADTDDLGASAPEVRGVWPTDPEGIRSAIREAMPDLRECYAGWVAANPDLHGVIKARFTITPSADGSEGRVTDVVAATSTLDQPFLEGCVLNVLGALRFEAPTDGPLTVSYPFILSSDR